MKETELMPLSKEADRLDYRRLRAWELYQENWKKSAIARELGISASTIGNWIAQAETKGIGSLQRRNKSSGPVPRLSEEQLRILNDLLQQGAQNAGFPDDRWTHRRISQLVQQIFDVTYHPNYIKQVLAKIPKILIGDGVLKAYHTSPQITLYCGDAAHILSLLEPASVDCIITSPPYYGQRDYGVPDQIGLEKHPQMYIDRLVAVFTAAQRVLKPTGSLWINIGDTYWSGKGRPHGADAKQKNRRFLRPQDQAGQRPWCTPKQLLLIPHRFAIAMQEQGWIVRNDNVWSKANPTPDPAEDRCASAHEYMFHFVMRRHYYFDKDAVAIPSQGKCDTKPPPSVWTFHAKPSFKKHIAVFPEDLVRIPILATCPPNGVLLDPFCGSGTALSYTVAQGEGRCAIGIDISEGSLLEAQQLLHPTSK